MLYLVSGPGHDDVSDLVMTLIGEEVILFLAHLSQSDRVSFCDRFSSGVRPASVRKLLL
jgi:hypothetical protein